RPVGKERERAVTRTWRRAGQGVHADPRHGNGPELLTQALAERFSPRRAQRAEVPAVAHERAEGARDVPLGEPRGHVDGIGAIDDVGAELAAQRSAVPVENA